MSPLCNKFCLEHNRSARVSAVAKRVDAFDYGRSDHRGARWLALYCACRDRLLAFGRQSCCSRAAALSCFLAVAITRRSCTRVRRGEVACSNVGGTCDMGTNTRPSLGGSHLTIAACCNRDRVTNPDPPALAAFRVQPDAVGRRRPAIASAHSPPHIR
jgi:hypothetical protein